MREQSVRIHRRDYTPPRHLVDTIELTFVLDEDNTRVNATTKFRRNPDAAPGPLLLNGVGMTLHSIAIDGVPLKESDYKITDEELTVDVDKDTFTLEVVTDCHPKANKALEGLYVSRGTFCTQCEAEGFRKITFYPDRPDVLAKFTTTIIGDKAKTPRLLSNGNLVESRDLDDGKHLARWVDPFPKPSYLFALVAGDLARVDDSFQTKSGKTAALHLYVEEKDLDKTEHCLRALKNSMKFDEEAFGREYDLDLFQIVAISDFNMGAMENKGLNVFNTKFVLAKPETATDVDFAYIEGVVGHEYFHNWSGNRVTCRDWFQLSLKEGFTVFRDQEFSSTMGSRAVKRIEDVTRLRAMQFPEDAGPFAHPVRPDSFVEINNFYTVTIYEKGAEVVRMLSTLLGDDVFRKGCDLYFSRHDGQAVTCDDFVKAHEDASGRDLTQFRRWYEQAGTPTIDASLVYDADAKTASVTLKQSIPATPGQDTKLPMHIPVRLALLDREGGEFPLASSVDDERPAERVVELRDATETFHFANVDARPVLSLFRGFSAPVKTNIDETFADLLFRASSDSDAFNRWDAAQRILTDAILAIAKTGADDETLVANGIKDAFLKILSDKSADPALVAQAISLPSPAVVSEEMDVVDVERLFLARHTLRRALAKHAENELRARYDALIDDGAYVFERHAVAKRSLKNVCLSYLNALSADGELAAQHFDRATNMTDSLAALQLLSHLEKPVREEKLHTFFQRFEDDALVLDKWFAIQATSERVAVLDDVERLLKHPSFDDKNPNKIRALISSFSSNNMRRFHDPSGRGYKFLASQVLRVETFNPQIAARLVVPLTRWRRHGDDRGALMRLELERIAERAALSKDVREMVEKALT